MSDIKRYYYLKLKDNFFDSEEIKILESLPNGIYYSNLLIKLYLKSLKCNGALRINDCIPFDENMIATITNLNIDIVRNGLKVLSSLKLIERLHDGTIYMMNIQSFIGKSSSEADRKRLYREKIEEQKLILGQMSTVCLTESDTGSGLSVDKRPPETEKDIDKDIDLDIEKDKSNIVSESVNILKNFEEKTGLIGGLNLGALKTAVQLHGAENVNKAMDTALERNKPTMIYINGILRNWSKEGYPKEGEYNGNGIVNKNTEAGRNEFSGFKPREPRTIAEGERSALEKELI
jgi:predicted phage replisome organizer